MSDDYIPDWNEGPVSNVPPGTYFWSIHIWDVELPPPGLEKPFVKMFFEVVDGPQAGFKNSWPLYITPRGKRWALWCLRKFGYPEELLGDQPVIRRSALIGLSGKIQAEATEDARGFQLDVKGFERLNETELEDRIKRKEEISLPKEEEPVIDINADLDGDLSFLDREDDSTFHATDVDLPDIFFEPPEKEEQ